MSEYNLRGDYRKVIEFASDAKWTWASYSDPNTDLDGSDAHIAQVGDHAALILSFSLSSSTYATMCLRQVMNTSARPADQMALSNKL